MVSRVEGGSDFVAKLALLPPYATLSLREYSFSSLRASEAVT